MNAKRWLLLTIALLAWYLVSNDRPTVVLAAMLVAAAMLLHLTYLVLRASVVYSRRQYYRLLATRRFRAGDLESAINLYARANDTAALELLGNHAKGIALYTLALKAFQLAEAQQSLASLGEAILAAGDVDLAYTAFREAKADQRLTAFEVTINRKKCERCDGRGGYWASPGSLTHDFNIDLANSWYDCTCAGGWVEEKIIRYSRE